MQWAQSLALSRLLHLHFELLHPPLGRFELRRQPGIVAPEREHKPGRQSDVSSLFNLPTGHFRTRTHVVSRRDPSHSHSGRGDRKGTHPELAAASSNTHGIPLVSQPLHLAFVHIWVALSNSSASHLRLIVWHLMHACTVPGAGCTKTGPSLPSASREYSIARPSYVAGRLRCSIEGSVH